MAEPAGKRFKSSLPRCTSHWSSGGRGASLQAAVEEALCAVSCLLFRGVYKLQALASVFERDDGALPHVVQFFHYTAQKQQEEVEELLHYLSQRGGSYCGQDIQSPAGCESVCGVMAVLDLLLLLLTEEVEVLTELVCTSRHNGDPQTTSFIQSKLIRPRLLRLKQIANLRSNAHKLGCTMDKTGHYGEYLLNELQEELKSG